MVNYDGIQSHLTINLFYIDAKLGYASPCGTLPRSVIIETLGALANKPEQSIPIHAPGAN